MKANSILSIREYLSLEIGHRLVTERQGDQYLVSYPRSGNTWMRTMLGVLKNPAADGNPDFTRQNLPGVSIRNAKKINQLHSPRLIKSHTWYRPAIHRAVYIVRDGRDVLVSLYHYFITRAGRTETFGEFLTAYLQGSFGPLWHDNVISWLTRGRDTLGEDLLVITFEDLKSNTMHVLAQAAGFLGISPEEDLLAAAVRAADIGRMRKIESQRRGPVDNENASFYRGGKTGEWRDYLTPELEGVFLEAAGDALKLAGYLG